MANSDTSAAPQTGFLKAWWCKSLWSQLVMNKYGGGVRAHLEWDTSAGTIALVEVDAQEKSIRDIFRVAATELSQVEFKWSYFTFKMQGKTYTIAARDDVIDALVLAGFFGTSPVYADVAASAIANQSGINKNMASILQGSGVKVGRIHVLRGILLGVGIGIVLLAAAIAYLRYFYTHM